MEYEALQPVMEVMRAILNARIRAGMTQKMLAEKSEISQADISRLENGTRNSSMALLKRLAEAMESTLKTEDSRQKTVLDLLREPDLKGSFVLIMGKQRPVNRPPFCI